MTQRMLEVLAELLDPAEREAVLGDLAESGKSNFEAARDIAGLLARRQAAAWMHPRPWLVLLGLAIPLAFLLSRVSGETAAGSSVTLWLYLNNWDWALFQDAGYRHDIAAYSAEVFTYFLMLACWSWASGAALATLSRGRATLMNGIVFCSIPLIQSLIRIHHYQAHDAVFEVTFYRVIFPPLVLVTLVLFPSFLGIRQGSKAGAIRASSVVTLALIVFLTWVNWRFPIRPRTPFLDGILMQVLRALACWPVLYWIASAIRRPSKESKA